MGATLGGTEWQWKLVVKHISDNQRKGLVSVGGV